MRGRVAGLAIFVVAAAALAAGWSLFWFLCDDAFIAFRYVDHARRGLLRIGRGRPKGQRESSSGGRPRSDHLETRSRWRKNLTSAGTTSSVVSTSTTSSCISRNTDVMAACWRALLSA